MRKLVFVLLIACLLAACTPVEHVQEATPTPSPAADVTPAMVSATPTLTTVPARTHAAEPESLPMFTEYIAPGKDTVIIANSDGLIIGGYSDGHWLSHSQAAAYCGQSMTFTMKNLDGYADTLESTGVIMEFGGEEVASGTVTMGEGITDYNDFMYLDTGLPEYDPSRLDCVLYYCPPERSPQITRVRDVSPFLLAVQNILDAEFGTGTVSAQINDAYIADIDGDGTAEVVVNAYNNESWGDDSDAESYWYSIVLIIEDSGAVCEVARWCWYGYWEDVDFACVRGILDVDGDGRYEVIREQRGYEWWLMDVFQYDGQKLSWVFGLSTGS